MSSSDYPAHRSSTVESDSNEFSQQHSAVDRELDELFTLYSQLREQACAMSRFSTQTRMGADLPEPVRYARRQRIPSRQCPLPSPPTLPDNEDGIFL